MPQVVQSVQTFVKDPVGTAKNMATSAVQAVASNPTVQSIAQAVAPVVQKAKVIAAPAVQAVQTFVKDPIGTTVKAGTTLVDAGKSTLISAGQTIKTGLDQIAANLNKSGGDPEDDPIEKLLDTVIGFGIRGGYYALTGLNALSDGVKQFITDSANGKYSDVLAYLEGAGLQIYSDITLGLIPYPFIGNPEEFMKGISNPAFQGGRIGGNLLALGLSGYEMYLGAVTLKGSISIAPDLVGGITICTLSTEGLCSLLGIPALAIVGALAAVGMLEMAHGGLVAIKSLQPIQYDAPKSSDSTDRLNNEAYKDELRIDMEKPYVEDPDLSKMMDQLYRETATVGNGSTAAAVREEIKTGQPVGGVWHTQKAQDAIRFLEKWIDSHPNASQRDIAAAQNVMKDLQNALGGK
jgi:hypothetical protein